MTISVKDSTGAPQTVKTIDDLAADGGQATLGITSGAAVTSDAAGTIQQYLRGLAKALAALTSTGNALDINVKSGGNSNGTALAANSAPTVNAPTTFRIAVTPTVTASAYTAGNVMGGIMTFALILLPSPTGSPTKWSGILESINVKFKATAVTGEIDVGVFTASPAGGTYTDKVAPTWNLADTAKLVGIYALPTPISTLGTMTTYNLDGIGAAIDGASTSLFVVMTVKGTPTPATTSDVIVELGVLQG